MRETTPNLDLPYLRPAQAQKHITHNDALTRLDAITQLVLVDDLVDPPEDAADGDCFIVSAGAGGPWSGKDGKIAVRQDGGWLFLSPREGWRAYFLGDHDMKIFAEGQWQSIVLPSHASVGTLGINATADNTNRLCVSAPATLFNHAGSDHRLTINRQASADTAAVVFQTDWLGHAEIGLAGNSRLALKVSPDGTNWFTAMDVSPAGVVDQPNRPLVSATLSIGAYAPPSDSQIGFDTVLFSQGGFTLGSAAPGSGMGNRLIVPADGFYAINLRLRTSASSGHHVTVLRNESIALASLTGQANDQNCVNCLAQLVTGDSLTLGFSGASTIDFSPENLGLEVYLI
ncbi:DUF2793 domain-containing protein [Ciceribacter sp. L1K23]|uniref:DUF2793 domain-containing protein n=1 Tax=Ciceribacter sp. L1K23 TaxID=2820276 RepID=UPI001B83C528|nr:DUF2793 domain-containing protein [Ciceribacter sp. L1K23]MBR0554775.1 DUF2793 domain-containing protein [Ciceribacter sp. L1K23]